MPDMDFEQYPQHEVKVLKGLDAVKIRPEMYLPNYKRDGIRQMILITLDNFLSIKRGHLNSDIKIDKEERSITIIFQDLPSYDEVHPDLGKRTIQILLEELHACACNSKLFHGYQSLGVGVSVANAFCRRLEWYSENLTLVYENANLIFELDFSSMPIGQTMLVMYPIDDITFDAI